MSGLPPKEHVTYIAWRFYLTLFLIFLSVVGLGWRIFALAVVDQNFLKQQGDERVLRLITAPAFRGMIVDRNGYPLAVSTIVFSAWINPKEFEASKESLSQLAHLVGIKEKEILLHVERNKKRKREFFYLKRSLSPEIANKIKSWNIPGVYLQQEYKRYYPEGETFAQLLGFTNIDDVGQEGLELAYNQWLAGEPSKKWVIKDRFGRVIADVKTVSSEKRGNDLIISADRRIQYLAHRELLKGIIKYKATSGSAIVLDAKTGEILAMVNQPSFNPNNRLLTSSDTYRNRAITDTFEPGSTIKAFSIASVFESGQYHPDSIIDTSPGWIRVGHNIVKDEHQKGPLSVMQILQYSSNVGVTKMILSIPPNQLFSLLHRIGFGEITGIGFPGERSGSLVQHDPWGAFTVATLSFGYGLSVTTLQLARAYAVLANGGIKIPPSLLRIDSPPKGERVLDQTIAKNMLTLLESVTEKGGTAEAAKIPGYRIAGKTGTAKKVGALGYEDHHHTSSFVGIAPLSNPKLVVVVVIHDPQGKVYYGGFVAGPVFKQIMEGALRILDIPPDC